MTPGIFSPWHLAIFVLVVLIVFGPKRLPEIGHTLGKGIREFTDSMKMADVAAEPSSPPRLESGPAPEHDQSG